MKKIKILLAALLVTTIISSCGLFKKDCNCPHFGMQNTPVKVIRTGTRS